MAEFGIRHNSYKCQEIENRRGIQLSDTGVWDDGNHEMQNSMGKGMVRRKSELHCLFLAIGMEWNISRVQKSSKQDL